MIKYDEKLQQYIIDEENKDRFTLNDFESIESVNNLRKLKPKTQDKDVIDTDDMTPLCFAALNNVDPFVVFYMVSKDEPLIPKYLVNDKPVTATVNTSDGTGTIDFNGDCKAVLNFANITNPSLSLSKDSKKLVTASLGMLTFNNGSGTDASLSFNDGFELNHNSNNIKISSSELEFSNSQSNKYKLTFDDGFGIIKDTKQIVKFDDSKFYIGNNCITFNGSNLSIDTGSTSVSLNNYTDLIVNGSKFVMLTSGGFKIAASINNLSVELLVDSNGPSLAVNGLQIKAGSNGIRINNAIIAYTKYADDSYSFSINGIDTINLKDLKNVSLNINDVKFSVSLDDGVSVTVGDLKFYFNKTNKEVSLSTNSTVLFKAAEKSNGFEITVDDLMLNIIKNVGASIIDRTNNTEILSAYKRDSKYTVKLGSISGSIDTASKSLSVSFSGIGTITASLSSPNSFSLSYSYGSSNSIELKLTFKSNEFIFSINDFKFTITFVPFDILINGVSLIENNLFYGTDEPLKGLGYNLTKKSKGKTPLQHAITSGNTSFIEVLNGKEFKVPILFGRGRKNV
jgi:hypothetical protein